MKIALHKHSLSWLLSVFLIVFCSARGSAQEVKPEWYDFGDAIRFTGDRDYNIALRGYIQPAFESKWYTDETLEGAYNRFRIRRLRLRIEGDAARHKIRWRLQFDLSGNNEVDDISASALMDAWVSYRFSRNWRVRFGQKNTATDNRQLLVRSHTLQLAERSRVTSAFSSIREFGFFFDGNYRVGSSYIRPSIVITNGDGLNAFGSDFGGLKYGGRLDFLPFGTFVNLGQYHEVDMMRELTPKLVIGAAYSWNQGMSSRRGRTSGDILYFDQDTVLSLPNFGKLCVDFIFKYKGFSAVGEFVYTHASVPDNVAIRQRNNGTFSSNLEVDGVQDPENYVKGRMMLGTGYHIMMGYLFKNRWSVDARYTYLDADQHSFLNNGTFYNRPHYYTFGVSKYFSKMYGFKIQSSITYVDALDGSNDITSTPMDGDEWIFRIITTLAF